jgi:formylglycine-generating enzyme required for sulfatase activity
VGTEPAAQVSVLDDYSIDATEVTRCQYEVWLASNPDPSGQTGYCSWNTSFVPACEWPPGTLGSHPVVCVDWCDADAYCKAVGKRLCGKIGGGTNAMGQYANPNLSQWFAACSSNGQNDYPYGDTFDGQACNGPDKGVGTTVPVGSLATCQSYPGIYDLSGNVLEWEDSCNGIAGPQDNCRMRGGAWGVNAPDLRCDAGYTADRDDLGGIGFRCCSSP